MSELVDLVNKHGEIQKHGVPRHEVQNHPDLHMQIAMVIARDSLMRFLVHRRGKTKDVDPEKYDHICGVIRSNETPEEAGLREGQEETGVQLRNIRRVHAGVNEYGRYRHLMIADAEGQPSIIDPEEVMWVGYMHSDELHERRTAGEGFVNGFFEDVELAIQLGGTR